MKIEAATVGEYLRALALTALAALLAAGSHPAADPDRDLRSLDEALESGRREAGEVLGDPAFSYLHSDTRFRDLVRRHAKGSRATLASPAEPGEPLIVSGTIRGDDGRPVAGALVQVFHADAQGRYTPERAMDEPHARLFAFLATDGDGRYEFQTVRPGGYANAVRLDGEDRKIPAHIHYVITAAGHRELHCQLVFSDDPRMSPWWHDWAMKGGNPIGSITRGADGIWRCVCDLTLSGN
jgi:hypothetical protein